MIGKLFGIGGRNDKSTSLMPETSGHEAVLTQVLDVAFDHFKSKNPFFSFLEAFTNRPGYVQRDLGEARQVIEESTKLNFILETDQIELYVSTEDVASVAQMAMRILSKKLESKFELTKSNLSPNGAEAYVGRCVPLGSILQYNATVVRSPVSYPGGARKDGAVFAIKIRTKNLF